MCDVQHRNLDAGAALRRQTARRDAAFAAGAVAVAAAVCACCGLLCSRRAGQKSGRPSGHHPNGSDGIGLGVYDGTSPGNVEGIMGAPGALEREEGMPLQLQLGVGALGHDGRPQQGYGI